MGHVCAHMEWANQGWLRGASTALCVRIGPRVRSVGPKISSLEKEKGSHQPRTSLRIPQPSKPASRALLSTSKVRSRLAFHCYQGPAAKIEAGCASDDRCTPVLGECGCLGQLLGRPDRWPRYASSAPPSTATTNTPWSHRKPQPAPAAPHLPALESTQSDVA